MKAVQLSKTGGPETLEYVDIAEPTPADGQAVVRVESISVNYADVMIRKGIYPAMPPLPAVLGLEAAGVVESVGKGVTETEACRRVSLIGEKCYAEKIVADAASLIPIPENIDFDTAAAFPVTYLTAYHLLHTLGRVKRGSVVLLYAAAGGVGTSLIQLAKIAEVNVIGLTSSDNKAARLAEMGVDHTFKYGSTLVEDVIEVSGGKGGLMPSSIRWRAHSSAVISICSRRSANSSGSVIQAACLPKTWFNRWARTSLKASGSKRFTSPTALRSHIRSSRRSRSVK